MHIIPESGQNFDIKISVAIIGGGACGLVAALALADEGISPLVFERDSRPSGSTALSSGMIPACNTFIQRAKGIIDTVDMLANDIQDKAQGQANHEVVKAVAEASGPTVDWLVTQHGINLTLVDSFLYPGFSALRMHAPPSRQGKDLMDSLLSAARNAQIDIITNTRVTNLIAKPDGHITGFHVERPNGITEIVGCQALILACNGFGGNPDLIKKYIPEMATAEYFGHPGNRGEAIIWGKALGAEVRHVSAYQGHASVATPHGILITWALIMNGGIQINKFGKRFSNEHRGYSEQAVDVLAQPDGIAWIIFDDRLLELGKEFEEFNLAIAAGAARHGSDVSTLAKAINVPEEELSKTINKITNYTLEKDNDPFGRSFADKPPLIPPYHAIKVTGALFHTQGGLDIDAKARVLRPNGVYLPNLFAGGGAACGISGSKVWGYLSGNGLLTAVNLGRIAGKTVSDYITNRVWEEYE